MHITKGRHLLSAKFHCQITGQILMNAMDLHKKRCYDVLRLFLFLLLEGTLCTWKIV